MLIRDKTVTVINTEEITKGSLIWAKRANWSDGRTGVISDVSEKYLLVAYMSEVMIPPDRFEIKASELAAGIWQLRYSNDGMLTILTYGMDGEEEADGSESTDLLTAVQ